jgi:hypothetical protein
LSDHDAHRLIRDDEDLSQIFTLQEDRKISKELTLHYRGNVYLIDPNPETLRLRGRMGRVYANARGRVEIRREGQRFPFRAFHKLRRVTQADIVSNKRLGAVLAKIQADQQERDRQRLSSRTVTLREKRQIRAARVRADALVNP